MECKRCTFFTKFDFRFILNNALNELFDFRLAHSMTFIVILKWMTFSPGPASNPGLQRITGLDQVKLTYYFIPRSLHSAAESPFHKDNTYVDITCIRSFDITTHTATLMLMKKILQIIPRNRRLA